MNHDEEFLAAMLRQRDRLNRFDSDTTYLLLAVESQIRNLVQRITQSKEHAALTAELDARK